MNVGDYVRTKNGIDKVAGYRYEPEYENGHVVWFEKSDSGSRYIDKELPKSSPQIKDLIEAGDFITYKQGNFYWNVFEQVSGRYNRENQMTDLIVDNKPLNTVEILTVITHEQMESMQYRVEE